MTKRISREAEYLLYNLNAQTHPNKEFRDWIDDPSRDSSKATQELLDHHLIKEINGIFSPTKVGIKFFNQANPEINELVTKIRMAIPKNLPFGVIVESLTNTALMGLAYSILGEIGRRGPDDQVYWQSKIDALSTVLSDTTPDKLWERHCKQLESF